GGRVLRQSVNTHGYVTYSLYHEGRWRRHSGHRLVAEAFIGAEPIGKPYVLHNDGDPTNNRVENLRWGTNQENQIDSVGHGTNYNANKSECKRGHPYDELNTYVDSNGRRSCKTCRVMLFK